jgi:hypothetical protein
MRGCLGPPSPLLDRLADHSNVRRLEALGAAVDFELHYLSFGETAKRRKGSWF